MMKTYSAPHMATSEKLGKFITGWSTRGGVDRAVLVCGRSAELLVAQAVAFCTVDAGFAAGGLVELAEDARGVVE